MQNSPQQLALFAQSLESEINHLSSSFSSLKQILNKFQECQQALASHISHGLIPLTSSLYVRGNIIDDKVMTEIGTGYFIKRSKQDASEFYERRIQLVSQNMMKVAESLNQKEGQMQQVVATIQRQGKEETK